MSDKSLNKSQKFVKLLQLISRPGGANAQEMMTRFEIDARTLRRYLADLRTIGVPIRDEGAGQDRNIGVDPSYARSGIQLTLSEVLSLHFGRTLFTFLDGTSFAADLEGAIERLEPAISRAAAHFVKDLDRKFMAVPEHAKDYRADGDLLDEIVSALLYSNPADAEYRPVRGVSKFYRLEPLTLATYRQGLYLFARDVSQGAVKCFAVERFLRFSRLRREHFDYPTDFDPQQLVGDSFGITGGTPEEVQLCFTAEVAPFIRERHWHDTQRLEILADGGVRLKLKVAPSPEVKEWILGFGPDVKVEAPAALAKWVKQAHTAAAERYA